MIHQCLSIKSLKIDNRCLVKNVLNSLLSIMLLNDYFRWLFFGKLYTLPKVSFSCQIWLVESGFDSFLLGFTLKNTVVPVYAAPKI